MTRGRLLGLILLASAAVGLALGRHQLGALVGRLTGKEELPTERQWDFDRDELRGLMDRVLDEQRERVSQLDGPQRERAQAFLEYYERRRAAAG